MGEGWERERGGREEGGERLQGGESLSRAQLTNRRPPEDAKVVCSLNLVVLFWVSQQTNSPYVL